MPTPRRGAQAAAKITHRQMARYELDIEGVARAKGRPRVTRNGTYTPESTTTWEETVGWEFVRLFGRPRVSGPVSVRIEFNQKRGDLDNLAKAILDGLNGVAWIDDSQVCQLLLFRPPEPKGRAHTVITIEEMRQ